MKCDVDAGSGAMTCIRNFIKTASGIQVMWRDTQRAW
jgi:hypothetical protein